MIPARKFQFGPTQTLMPGHAPLRAHPAADLFPMLADHRRPSFRDSLAQEQLHPITLHRGMILDGRNRYRELTALNKPVLARVFDGSDRDALDFVIVENMERRDLSDRDRTIIAGSLAKFNVGANGRSREAPAAGPSLFQPAEGEDASSEAPSAPLSIAERAQLLNVKERGVKKVDAINAHGTEELKQVVRDNPIALDAGEALSRLPAEEQKAIIRALPRDEEGKLTKDAQKEVLEEAKRIRKEQNDKRRADRVEKIKAAAAGNTELPTAKKFPVIYMDPPTKFAAGDSDRSTENHYPTMTEEEIAKLPVSDLATDDAVLFIWSTVPWLRKTMRLIEAWGFDYVSEFVWDKQALGLGFWNRNVHESLLIATRGKMLAPDPSVLERSLYSEERGRHSAKPEKFRQIISAYYPDFPKVELFSRVDGVLPEGWHAWGNETRVQKQQTLGVDGEEQAA